MTSIQQKGKEQSESPHPTQAFIVGFWGVRYQVKDVQQAITFYTQTLGFNLDMQNLPAFAQVSVGGLKLILSGPGTSGSQPMPDGRQQEPGGWNRVLLQVSDLPARIADMKKAGLCFRNEMEIGPVGKQIQIEDPDGNPVELFEPLCTIPGVDVLTAWTLPAELGADVSAFPDAAHAASWAGLCPGNRETAGKRLSSRTQKGNRWLRRALCQSARAVSHTKDCYLTAHFYRRAAQHGVKKAIIATAHQLLIIAYHLLRDRTVYRELGGNFFDLLHPQRTQNRLVRRLERLGLQVVIHPPCSACRAASSQALPRPPL